MPRRYWRRRWYWRLDPKRVRWFFYRRSLFVQVFTLFTDGLWWLVVRGWRGIWTGPLALWRWIWPPRLGVSERQRRLHSFIVGRTGSGKSVLMHHLIRHYLVYDRRPTLVILDPHSDLAEWVARDRSLARSERLVYVDFNAVADRYVHFNPFDLTNPTAIRLNRAQLQFAGAVEQLVGEAFSPSQRTLIRSCLGVVLHQPGATLVDLVRLLQDKKNADLLAYAETQLPNPIDRQFFQSAFHDTNYRTTKLALVSRLTDILRDPIVQRFTCAESSFDLSDLLQAGKVIVVRFDPNTQGRATITTLGQLLTAAITSFALGRPKHKRHPIHLFVDEVQMFLSPAIADALGENRKFGLYLTLATQRTDRLDPDLLQAILSNVGNFWVGGSRYNTADTIARETGLDSETLRNLPNLRFTHAAVNRAPITHRLPYLGQRYWSAKEIWRQTLAQQAERYYRSPGKQTPTVPPAAHQHWAPEVL